MATIKDDILYLADIAAEVVEARWDGTKEQKNVMAHQLCCSLVAGWFAGPNKFTLGGDRHD
jgi:hypothetical protein